MKALGAYVYAGGFTVGVKRYFNVAAHLEGADGYGANISKLNHPKIPIHLWPHWPGSSELGGGIDFVYGNPPCAAWSVNNPKAHTEGSWKDDPRIECTRQHFGLLAKHKPKVWTWESVCQAPDKGKELVDELTTKAMRRGYSVTQIYHDAQWHGVPQVRRRWFMVAHNVQMPIRAPNWAPATTVGEALAGIQPRGEPAIDRIGFKRDFPAKVLKKIPQGMRLRKYWETVMRPDPSQWVTKDNGAIQGRPSFGYAKLRLDRPACATVGYGMVHPTEPRFLSVNEVAVLAGFPESYQFEGDALGVKQLDYIARGVCPPVGAWIAGEAKRAIAQGMPVTRPVRTVIDYRLPPS